MKRIEFITQTRIVHPHGAGSTAAGRSCRSEPGRCDLEPGAAENSGWVGGDGPDKWSEIEAL